MQEWDISAMRTAAPMKGKLTDFVSLVWNCLWMQELDIRQYTSGPLCEDWVILSEGRYRGWETVEDVMNTSINIVLKPSLKMKVTLKKHLSGWVCGCWSHSPPEAVSGPQERWHKVATSTHVRGSPPLSESLHSTWSRSSLWSSHAALLWKKWSLESAASLSSPSFHFRGKFQSKS